MINKTIKIDRITINDEGIRVDYFLALSGEGIDELINKSLTFPTITTDLTLLKTELSNLINNREQIGG